MSLFDIDPRREAEYAIRARTRPATAFDMEPSPLEGAIGAPFVGLSAAFDATALAAGEFATPPLQVGTRKLDDMIGTNATGWLDAQRRIARERVDGRRVDAATTGYASQFIADLFRMGGEAALGYAVGGPMGAATLTAGAEGVSSYRRGVASGLDPATAEKMAAVEGVAAGAGVTLPMVGPTLRSSILLGIEGNVGLGVAQRLTSHEVLARAGYPDMAAQYRVFDAQAIAVDGILGLAFGAFGHVLHRRPAPETIDAALALDDSRHAADSGPGLPADPGAMADSARALDQAMHELATDQPVSANVPPDATFVPDPAAAAWRAAASEEVAKAYPDLPRDRKRVEPAADSISVAIAKLGGLDLDQARAEWGATIADDRRALNQIAWQNGGPFGRHVLRRGGLPIDSMVEALVERGYLPRDEHGKGDFNDLFERLSAEAGGDRQFTPEGVIANAERKRAIEQREIDDEARAEREAIQAESAPPGLEDVVVTDKDGNEVRAKDAYTLLERARQDTEVEKRLLEVAANCEAALT